MLVLGVIGARLIGTGPHAGRFGRMIRVAAYESPPYYFVQGGGRPRGLAVELIDLAAAKSGIKIEWVILDRPMAEALDAALIDLVPVVSVTRDRGTKWHLTKPWLRSSYCLVSRQGRVVAADAGLAGKSVAHVNLPVTREFARAVLP